MLLFLIRKRIGRLKEIEDINSFILCLLLKKGGGGGGGVIVKS